jgi:hypothetical protein
MRFEVLMVLTVKITGVLGVTVISLVEICHHFGGTWCLHHQDRGVFYPEDEKAVPDYTASLNTVYCLIRCSGCTGGYVGQSIHVKSRGLYFFYGKGNKTINWEQDFLCTTE